MRWKKEKPRKILANDLYFRRKWSEEFKQRGEGEKSYGGSAKGTFWGQVKGPTEAGKPLLPTHSWWALGTHGEGKNEAPSGRPAHSRRLEFMNELDFAWYCHKLHALIFWALWAVFLLNFSSLPSQSDDILTILSFTSSLINR